MTEISKEERAAIRAGCTRFLSYGLPRSAADWVAALGHSPHLALGLDMYSEGPAIAALEERVAALLGKAAGLWFPKGIMAQQSVLLVHAAAARAAAVVVHPQSHLARDEADALERLAGLTALRLGSDVRHFTVADLDKVHERLAAVTVELPLRTPGYQALEWDRLVEISAWARERNIAFHLDGARLWEVQPWYGRPLTAIAGLADTVYVSLYKGLGGLGGCVLAGDRAVIEAAKPWRKRYGGDLPVAFPMIVSALDGLDEILPRMDDYFRRAGKIAAAIDAVEGLSVFPNPPHCNSFQVHFAASAVRLNDAALRLAQERKLWLFGGFSQGLLAESASGEIVVGDATMAWTIEEVVGAMVALRDRTA